MNKITNMELSGYFIKKFKDNDEKCSYLRLQTYLWYFLNLLEIEESEYKDILEIRYSSFNLWRLLPIIPEVRAKYNFFIKNKIEPVDYSDFKFKDELDYLCKMASIYTDVELVFAIRQELEEYYSENDIKFEDNKDKPIEKKYLDMNKIKDFLKEVE